MADNSTAEKNSTTQHNTAPKKRKRRFLQFGLRALILLVILAAVGAFWLRRQVENARNQRLAVESLRKLGAEVIYDYELDADGRRINTTIAPQLKGEPWIRELLGEDLFNHPQMVRMPMIAVTDEQLQVLQHMPELRTLYLSPPTPDQGNGLTDKTLRHIGAMRDLENLSLVQFNITDAGVSELRHLTKLKHLSLDGTHVTDAGIKHLAGMHDMGLLTLGDLPGVTDAGLVHLQDMAVLREVRLNNTGVRGPGLQQLTGKQNLGTVLLSGSPFTDEGMHYFQEMPALYHLTLSQTQITNAGLARLGKVPALMWLGLRETQITDAGFKHLAGCQQLDKLGLSGPNVRGAGIADLAALPQMQYLDLDDSQLNEAGWAALNELKQVSMISLANARCTDENVKLISETMPQVTALTLSGTQVTDDAIPHLLALPNLQQLVLSGAPFSQDAILQLSQCSTLSFVMIDEDQLTPTAVQQFQAALPTCEVYLQR